MKLKMAPDTREQVRRLRARGFAVCKPDPSGKAPTYPRWPTRSLEPGDFAPADMVGILCGPLSDGNRPGHALIIVDLDAAEALALADEHLPPTDMVAGRPGKERAHRYYLVDVSTIPPTAVSQAAQAAPAAVKATGHAGPFLKHFHHAETKKPILDFLGTGGQAVCPPSTHQDGRRTWEGGEPGEPAVVAFGELWAAVRRLAETCGAEAADVEPPVPSNGRHKGNGSVFNVQAPGRAQRLDRAAKYLDKIEPAVSKQGGHNKTFYAACALVKGFDLTPEEAFPLLQAWNVACQPPWTDAELWHKVRDADTIPDDQPRGYLYDAGVNGNGKARRGAPPGKKPGASASGAAIIAEYFRERYRPDFRRGSALHCQDGREVMMGEACAVPTSALIERLAEADNAPRFKGEGKAQGAVNREALPGFFGRWAKVAWGDLLDSLPDEDAAELAPDGEAPEEFRRLVREAMLSEVVLGDVIGKSGVTQTEKRSLIDWCVRFAKPGPWRTIRSKKCWCRCREDEGGELVLMVAIRHEVFSQLKADRRLTEMGAKKFARRAARYGVGRADNNERPHGGRAILLDHAFVADLIASLPDYPLDDSGEI